MRSAFRVLALSIVVASACTDTPTLGVEAPPDTLPQTGRGQGASFTLGSDSIEISGPGEGRVSLEIADSARDPGVIVDGPFAATFEVTGGVTHRHVLIVDASAPGIGTVTLMNTGHTQTLKVVATKLNFQSISVDYGFGCGIAGDGRAWCWGNNGTGQLAANTTPPCLGVACQYGDGGSAKYPLPVAGNRVFSTTISTSGKLCTLLGAAGICGASCALTALGETYCWGAGAGQKVVQRIGPDRSLNSLSVADLGPSYQNSTRTACGVIGASEAYCLTSTGSSRMGGTMTFSAFSASESHNCGISAGDVYCWGGNTAGELGLGTIDSTAHLDPVKVVAPTTFTAVEAGFHDTCALGSDHRLYCWGRGFSAIGSDQPAPCTFYHNCIASPRLVGGAATYVDFDLSSSQAAVCGRKADGSVDCWTTFNANPTPVQSTVTFSSIGVGGTGQSGAIPFPFGCGLTADHSTWCWMSDFVATKLQ